MNNVPARRPAQVAIMLVVAASMMACEAGIADKKDPLGKSIIGEANLSDLLLTAGSPEEAIRFFEKALKEEPDKAEYRRGLAISLARAKRYPESARVYQELIALDQAVPNDRLEYAVVIARMQKWDEVRAIVDDLPEGLNTERRHTVEAMLADHETQWEESDAAYGRAEALANNPAAVLNNWGVSKLSRGDFKGAEGLFEKSLSYNSKLFSAKNNLAISRGLQGNFELPVVPMTETEKAVILNNLGVIAERQGKKNIARGLFVAAVETHPQHYEGAASRLAALEGKIEN